MSKAKHTNGKTSKRRQENIKKVRTNWSEIKGFKPSKFK
jgi:hypothetical protein